MSTVKNPEALNKLLEEILVTLFDQAQGEFQNRTGKTVKLGPLERTKVKLAHSAVRSAVKLLGRFGDPAERFEKIVTLTNEHLPTALNIIGEEPVLVRLEKMPKNKRDKEVVDALETAGATEIANLLRKAWPELQKAAPAVAVAAPVAAAAVVAATPAAATTPTPAAPAVAAPFAAAAKPGKAAEAAPSSKGGLRDKLTEAIGTLKGRLGELEALHAQTGNMIEQVRSEIAAMEDMAENAPVQWQVHLPDAKPL